MTRQSGQGRPRLPATDWVRCRGGKERAFCQTQTHGLPSAGRGPDLLPPLPRQVRFGHAVSSRTVAACLVLRQPTDANHYAPSLNEAFEDDNHSRELQMCYFLFFFFLIRLRDFRCHPEPAATANYHSLCPPGIIHLMLTVLTLPEEPCHRVAGYSCIPRRTKSSYQHQPLHLQNTDLCRFCVFSTVLPVD